jgi:hypothetical protein
MRAGLNGIRIRDRYFVARQCSRDLHAKNRRQNKILPFPRASISRSPVTSRKGVTAVTLHESID